MGGEGVGELLFDLGDRTCLQIGGAVKSSSNGAIWIKSLGAEAFLAESKKKPLGGARARSVVEIAPSGMGKGWLMQPGEELRVEIVFTWNPRLIQKMTSDIAPIERENEAMTEKYGRSMGR